jgi:hypothetical protein
MALLQGVMLLTTMTALVWSMPETTPAQVAICLHELLVLLCLSSQFSLKVLQASTE